MDDQSVSLRRPRLSDSFDTLLSSTRVSSTSTDMSPYIPVPSSSSRAAPVLRWLTTWSPNHTRTQSSPNPGSPSPSSPTSPIDSPPNLSLLREALNEPLIARPPAARLPPSFQPRTLSRPPFLDDLTRATLPTASLSPPLTVTAFPDATGTSDIRSPIILSHSPPAHSSLDTLRRVSIPSVRSISTTSTLSTEESLQPSTSSFLPSLSSTSFSWWFSETRSTSPPSTPKLPETAKKYKSTNNPVVFCHGLLGFDSVTIGPSIAPVQVAHWRGIKEVLEQNGTEVLITRVPATSSYVDRAKVLEERVSQVYPGRSVHLIGHSMGGLDCRYLTTHLTERKFDVLSITTIATPHRGSSFADHFLDTVGRNRLPSVLSILDLLPNGGGDGKAFECLTVENMKKFNEETPDIDGVKYFSWGAVYEPGLIDTWKWPHSVILEKEGPNDGLVSVESAKWGTYLGTLAQVNHLDLVGWISTARYKWAEIMGKEIKFRPAAFYLGIVDMLAKEVEGQRDEPQLQKPVEQQESVAGAQEEDEREREEMVHSLQEAGADVKSPSTNGSQDKNRSGSTTPRVSAIPKENASENGSENGSGSITPRSPSSATGGETRSS